MPADSTSIQQVHIAPLPATTFEPPGHVSQIYADGITTVLVDSIAADTVEGRIPHFIPVDEADSLRNEALADSMSQARMPMIPSGLSEGIAPMGMPPTYVNSTPLAALLMGSLVLAAVNSSSVARALKTYRAELWSVRRRPNVFDDEQSVPSYIAAILALVFIVFGGVVLYNLHGVPSPPTFAGAAASMGLLGTYYLFQQCAYRTVGYTFTTADGRRRWLGGFAATQAYAGLGMVIPALLMVFQPQWHAALLTISLSIYFAARLMFIIKSFRIFYQKIWSLLYFILYLCTLEILPLLAIYRISAILTTVI